MKKLFKLLALMLVIIMSTTSGYAMSSLKMDRLINGADFKDTATISVSVRNADSGSVIYQNDSKKLLHPASTLKVFTTYASLEALGYDYEFKTQFYKSGNDLYIKLGADRMLTTAQLKAAFKELK